MQKASRAREKTTRIAENLGTHVFFAIAQMG